MNKLNNWGLGAFMLIVALPATISTAFNPEHASLALKVGLSLFDSLTLLTIAICVREALKRG